MLPGATFFYKIFKQIRDSVKLLLRHHEIGTMIQHQKGIPTKRRRFEFQKFFPFFDFFVLKLTTQNVQPRPIKTGTFFG